MCRDKPGKRTQLVIDAEMSLLNAQFVKIIVAKSFTLKNKQKRPGMAHIFLKSIQILQVCKTK